MTYTQNYDAENRLISVNVSGQPLPTLFIYDGDGNLVKKIKPDNSKTLYVGGIYEEDKNSGGTITGTKTYYPAAGAMRVGSTLYYMLKDHLGSASVVTDSTAQANVVGEDRFYPFGETRFTSGTMFTDKLFTGQRQMTELGIYHYGARFYSPKLGRFLSADTIVPGYDNPQNLNRYSYGLNNPSRYTDPTGHSPDDGCGKDGGGCSITKQTIIDDYRRDKDFKDETERNKCKAGNKLHCSFAQNHPVQTALFPLVMWTGGATLEGFLLGGGGAANAALYEAGISCLQSAVCRSLTGMMGGAGVGAADAGNSLSAWQFPSNGPITQNGITFSKHALERMLPVGLGGRGVPPSVVENVVTIGQRTPTLTGNVVKIVSENVMVIYNTITDTVITVIKTGHQAQKGHLDAGTDTSQVG